MTHMRIKWDQTGMEDLFRIFNDYNTFGRQGMSRKVSLDYDVESGQPWVYFACPSDDDLSFRVHDLQLGDREAMFWHMFAQGEGKAKFNGFMSRLSLLGIKRIRGKMGVQNDRVSHETGFVVQNGIVEKVKTNDDYNRDSLRAISILAFPLMRYWDPSRT